MMHLQPAIAFLESLGGWEILAISVVILLLFGPKRLPEIIRLIGKTSAHFQRTLQDFKDQLMQGANELENPPPEPPEGDSGPPEDYDDKPHPPQPDPDPSGPPEGPDRPEPPRAG